MKVFLSTTALTLLLTGAATAEDGVRYALLSYDRLTFTTEPDEVNINQFVGELEYQTGQFLISGFAENLSADLGEFDGSVRELSASGAYFLSSEILLGLTASSIDDEFDTETVAGAFAQYRNPQVGAGLSILQNLDEDETTYLGIGKFAAGAGVELGAAFTSNSEEDGNGYVLSAEYDQGPIDARAYLSGNTDQDDNIFGARGAYIFAGSFRGTAAFESISGGEEDITSFRIGAGYRITDGAWADFAVGQTDGNDDATVDTLRLALTFETGDQVRIDREFARELREDFNNGAQQFRLAVEPLVPTPTP